MAPASAAHRSKITNGSQLLPGVDGRRADARRFRDLVASFTAELGGPEKLSAFDLASIRSLAGMSLRLEQLQAKVASGDAAVDADQLVRLSGTIQRLSKSLTTRLGKAAEPRLSLRDSLMRG